MPRQPHHHQAAQQQQQPSLLQRTIDNKCPLADNLQLAPLPPQYRAPPPLKYFGDLDPCKFLMCYNTAIASLEGNDTTLVKSFIILLEGVTTNWYVRLQPRSISSWYHLKEKFLINFQGFQAMLSTKEDFLSCHLYKQETLSDFFQRFLRLKAQAPKVSHEQVITHAIKALCVG
jgi:hypothetical protein